MNPKIYKQIRFNSYITENQKELLDRLSEEINCSSSNIHGTKRRTKGRDRCGIEKNETSDVRCFAEGSVAG